MTGGEYSKTHLRKGQLKTCGGSAIPRHAMQGKNGTSGEEEAALFESEPAPAKEGQPRRGGAREV